MFHNVALSGGGIYTIAFIGCVKYLYETNRLEELCNVIGTSGGSVICLMIILNYTWEEMRDFYIQICENDDSKHLFKYSVKDLLNIFKKYGINDGEIISYSVKKILKFKELSEDLTFIDLIKKTGKNLVIPVTNITQKKIEYISVDTYPEMKVVTAIRMSASIPIIFEPVKYYNDIYVDGLIFSNFPIDYFDKFTVDTLGLNIKSYEKTEDEIKTFKDYLNLLFESFINSLYRQKTQIKYEYICNIPIPKTIKNFNIYKLQFILNKEQIDELIDIGYNNLMSIFVQESV